MHAVGHVADRNIIERHAGPEIPPHVSGHFTVQPAHAVARGGEPQSQNRHAELFRLVVAFDARAQGIAPFDPEACRIPAEVPVHQVRREVVVPGCNRRMRGKDQRGRRDRAGLVETRRRVSIRCRMRSSERNAECPSFMWKTLGSIPRCTSAR